MGRKKSKNNYFTQETEDAIVAYNNSGDHVFRDKIFTEKIYFPLYKLAENIIHTFKFYYTDVDDLEDLKLEVVSLLVEEKLHMFDPTKGAKASAMYYSLIETAKKNDLEVFDYLNIMLEKLPRAKTVEDFEKLLPLAEYFQK